jgi:hypothetical protein
VVDVRHVIAGDETPLEGGSSVQSRGRTDMQPWGGLPLWLTAGSSWGQWG